MIREGRTVLPVLAALLLSCTWPEQSPPTWGPTIELRRIAAYGNSVGYRAVGEVSIAAAGNRAMLVFMHRGQDGGVGYSVHRDGEWKEGMFSTNPAADPSVVHDPNSFSDGGFVVCYEEGVGGSTGVITTQRYDIAADQFVPGDRRRIYQDDFLMLDKPWLARGSSPGQLHMFCMGREGLGYAGSSDSGLSWKSSLVRDVESGLPVMSTFCSQHSSAPERPGWPTFVAYRPFMAPDPSFKFLLAYENNGMRFRHLKSAVGGPSDLVLHLNDDGMRSLGQCVPGSFPIKTVPQIAADPTAPNRFYLVYHDLAPGSDTDLDVFCVRFEQVGLGWISWPPVRVNGIWSKEEADSFLPAVTVDDLGRVHVVYYDDGHYQNTESEPQPRFDVFCAMSDDQGRSFVNIKLFGEPDEPALDFAQANQISGHCPGEYPSITCNGGTVWAAFAGTSSTDPNLDRSVIYAVRIVW